ncbi:pyridoxal-phosphate dependent enzyme [Natrialba swarupiae]|nr:pyridoxal-phosphate dependent enzyme [Natrialba swarupiae]
MLELSDVLEAHERVRETSRHTLERSHTYSAMTGPTSTSNWRRSSGPVRSRFGATNRIATLSESQKEVGVVTASAGNHAQGVALAATRVGVDSTIVMPEHAPNSKVEATRSYGAEVVLAGTDYAEAAERAHEIEREEGRTYVHAFDDEMVMAGQGTIGLEILEDCPDVETVVVPIGGGGLISGSQPPSRNATQTYASSAFRRRASSAASSLEKGERVTIDGVHTIADGIATRSIGERTFEHIREHVDEVVTVSDPEIAVATIYLQSARRRWSRSGRGAARGLAVRQIRLRGRRDDRPRPLRREHRPQHAHQRHRPRSRRDRPLPEDPDRPLRPARRAGSAARDLHRPPDEHLRHPSRPDLPRRRDERHRSRDRPRDARPRPRRGVLADLREAGYEVDVLV